LSPESRGDEDANEYQGKRNEAHLDPPDDDGGKCETSSPLSGTSDLGARNVAEDETDD
jgi:hypothetical protein